MKKPPGEGGFSIISCRKYYAAFRERDVPDLAVLRLDTLRRVPVDGRRVLRAVDALLLLDADCGRLLVEGLPVLLDADRVPVLREVLPARVARVACVRVVLFLLPAGRPRPRVVAPPLRVEVLRLPAARAAPVRVAPVRLEDALLPDVERPDEPVLDCVPERPDPPLPEERLDVERLDEGRDDVPRELPPERLPVLRPADERLLELLRLDVPDVLRPLDARPLDEERRFDDVSLSFIPVSEIKLSKYSVAV